MTEGVSQKVLVACFRCLLPIARVLLKNGVGYREFDKLCRQAFVQTAAKEFGVRGRDTNTSRISAMTGIPRKEVQRLKQDPYAQSGEVNASLSPLADLLHVWATRPGLQDEEGVPVVLQFGLQGPFADLVHECLGDVPSGAVRAELLRLGVVEQTLGNGLRLVRRSLIPLGVDERLASALTYSLRGLAETIAHNNDPSTPDSELRFERYVESRPLSERQIGHVRQVLRGRLQRISEELDDLMNDRLDHEGTDPRRVGVGLYYTE